MKTKFNFQATCASGIESLAARELRDLDMENVHIDDRSRVFFDGDLEAMVKANLWLRTVERVKIVVGEFKAATFEDLFDKTFALDWENYLPLGCRFPVAKAKSIKSQLHNEPSVQSITKKAIVKKLQKFYHRPESQTLQENGAMFSIEVALYKDIATLTIDTTGEALFKRGYRKEHGGAPIKETMAAAIILMTNWLANPTRPFVDPTCGSGTFCIEAAMMGLNIAPGLKRYFAFEDWSWFDKKILSELKESAKLAIKRDINLTIQGSDIDSKMIQISHDNTVGAGLENMVKYKQMRLQDFDPKLLDGVIVSNPPYGERLGDKAASQVLYREMGETFRPLKTWSKYILTSAESFEVLYGEKATKKRKLYNGTLRTNLYQYFGQRIK